MAEQWSANQSEFFFFGRNSMSYFYIYILLRIEHFPHLIGKGFSCCCCCILFFFFPKKASLKPSKRRQQQPERAKEGRNCKNIPKRTKTENNKNKSTKKTILNPSKTSSNLILISGIKTNNSKKLGQRSTDPSKTAQLKKVL